MIKDILILLLFFAGLVFFWYPEAAKWQTERRNSEVIGNYEERVAALSGNAGNQGMDSNAVIKDDNGIKSSNEIEKNNGIEESRAEKPERLNVLYREMNQYNQEIYQNGQSDLKDPFSYEQASFNLREWEIEDGVFGYLTIPRMEIELPIYLGATTENMSKGAVHLSQTSLPIGGVNTNAVIAAHRGMRDAAMFRDIEKLEPGDEIRIRNFWGILYYEVSEIQVIYPDEISKVLIQEGRDLVTLITCHPYTQNYQRYVVYCERMENLGMSGEKDKDIENDTDEKHSDGIAERISLVQIETIVRWCGTVILAVAIIVYICQIFQRKKRR